MQPAMLRTTLGWLLLAFCLSGGVPAPAHAARAAIPFAAPASARAQGGFDRGKPRVTATLLAHPDDVARGAATDPAQGDSLRLGVLFELDPGWHLYWRDPGGSGLATVLRWDVPGASVEPVAWPAPRAFTESEGLFTTYGYDGRVLLATRARFDAGATRERIARVSADLLVCEVECIPATLALERRLDAPAGGAAERSLFAEAEQSLPLSPTALGIEVALHRLPAPRDAGEDGLAASLSVRP